MVPRWLAAMCAAALLGWTDSRTEEIPFANQTCAIGDINHGGHPDLVSGEEWYEGPHRIKHLFRPIEYFRNALEGLKHVIDYRGRVGAGMPIGVADLDGDGDLDFALGSKTGLFLFENLTHSAAKRGF
jgi:hypothetical protein